MRNSTILIIAGASVATAAAIPRASQAPNAVTSEAPEYTSHTAAAAETRDLVVEIDEEYAKDVDVVVKIEEVVKPVLDVAVEVDEDFDGEHTVVVDDELAQAHADHTKRAVHKRQPLNVGDCYINKQGQTECVVGMTGGRLQEQPNVDDYHSLDYPKQKESHGLTYVKDDGTEFKYGLDMDWSRCNVM